MPRTRLAAKVAELKRPAGAIISDMLRGYKREQKISADQMAKSMGLADGSAVRHRMQTDAGKYSLYEFKNYCRALGIPNDAALECLQRFMEKA